MKLVLVRHGQTYANVINHTGKTLYTGNLNNHLTDLTEKGIDSAKELGKLKEIQEIQSVYCSDLNRAIDTAKYAKPGYELNIDKRLRERDLGIFEGKEKQELLESEEYKKYVLDSRFNKFKADFFQRAPEGESYEEVSKRVKEFLESLDFDKNATIGIFAHFHCIRCLLLNLLDIQPKEKVLNLKIRNCEPYIIEKTRNSKGVLLSHKLEDLFETSNVVEQNKFER